VSKCGLISDHQEDTEGCVLEQGHEGPHQFDLENKSVAWVYDSEQDCDVYWDVPRINHLGLAVLRNEGSNE
jgi:hypothetical protein